MDVLHRPVIDLRKDCFFLVASVNNPYVYLRCKGIVTDRYFEDDTVGYYVSITEILETKETILDHLHNSKQRVILESKNMGSIKTIKCFDLVQNMKTFNAEFAKRYIDVLYYVPAVFAFTNENDLNTYFNKSLDLLTEDLEEKLRILKSRKK